MNTMNETNRQALIAQANNDLAKYPQYKGHFDHYVTVVVVKAVKTKLGQAFRMGELAIARPEPHVSNGKTFYTVYSHTNRCDTSVPAKWIVCVPTK
jgi:hypothetical protein